MKSARACLQHVLDLLQRCGALIRFLGETVVDQVVQFDRAVSAVRRYWEGSHLQDRPLKDFQVQTAERPTTSNHLVEQHAEAPPGLCVCVADEDLEQPHKHKQARTSRRARRRASRGGAPGPGTRRCRRRWWRTPGSARPAWRDRSPSGPRGLCVWLVCGWLVGLWTWRQLDWACCVYPPLHPNHTATHAPFASMSTFSSLRSR